MSHRSCSLVQASVTQIFRGVHPLWSWVLKAVPPLHPLATTSSQLPQEAVQQLEVCFAARGFPWGDTPGKRPPQCSAFGMAAQKEEEVKRVNLEEL